VKSMYIDSGINWSDPSITFKAMVDAGYNLIILAFYVSGSAADAAAAWAQLSSSVQQSTIAYAHGKNARIIVSAGGATDSPYNKFSGTQYGTSAANWAKANFLDGVDFDLENFGPGFTAGTLNTADSITWCVDATMAASQILGSAAVITHAPQPPYFGPNGFSDAYTTIYEKAPVITFLQIQYYNNGPANTYASIFTSNNGASVKEISANIPLSKLVVGKPVTSSDAGQGYIDAGTFHSFVAQAQSQLGWNAGVMGWQWHDATTNGNWISTIYP